MLNINGIEITTAFAQTVCDRWHNTNIPGATPQTVVEVGPYYDYDGELDPQAARVTLADTDLQSGVLYCCPKNGWIVEI